MEIMVNATVRRYMKERRPVYVRWRGNWYSGEVVRCGPAYVYKVKSFVNRDIYLLERSKLRLLEEDGDGDILPPGTDVSYYNQLSTRWEQGVIISHDDCGYAQIRWKMPGMYEEFVNWFDAANVSTTPPNMGHSKKLLKPGLFTTEERLSDNVDEDEDLEDNPLLQPGYKRQSQNATKPKLFAQIRSKQAPPRLSANVPQKDIANQVPEEFTVENIDPCSNPLPQKFSGIPPKWLAPTPMYYPCHMYVSVPVLVPHYPLRPPSISYPFFPAQIIEANFGRGGSKSKGVPPHKGALQLCRVVPKHQSRLLTRQPFSFSGRKLGKYEPKSLEADRKIEYLPSYESLVHSKSTNKRTNKVASTSNSSDEDIISLYSHHPASTDSLDEVFHPVSDSNGKNRTCASTEFTRLFVTGKKLSDLPSSSPAIKEPADLPVISTTEPSGKQYSHGTQGYDIMRDEEDDGVTDGQVLVTSSDSGVRTDTAAYSVSNQPHGDCSDDDQSSITITMIDNEASVTAVVPTIVVEKSHKRLHDTSDSEVFTSEMRVNPSHASIEQYLLGSGQSDNEHRERKSSSGSATELYLNTVASSHTLGHSTDVMGDITTTCRSKRRLMYSTSSEAETKPGSGDNSSNDESCLRQKSTEKQDFTTKLPTTEESLPGTPAAQNYHDDDDDDDSPPQSPVASNNNKIMSSFLKNLSPARLMSLRPKKKVTFTT